MDSSPESESSPPPPETIADLAQACVRFVEKAVGVELDYTQDTLPVLDHYLTSAEEVDDQVLGLLAPACGAYFGEVVRRHVGEGTWEHPEDYQGWKLTLESASVSFNPVGVALEVATQQDAPGWSAHFKVPEADREAAREAVDRLGEVPEDQYYTFSVRFEVLESVHAALRRVSEP